MRLFAAYSPAVFLNRLTRLRRWAVAMWGAPPRPAARVMTGRGVSLPCPAQDMAVTVCTKACTPYFQGAQAPHRIHWTAGKLLFRLQSEHGVRCGADAECSFPDGHAHRGRRREQGEQQGGGVRTRMTIGAKAVTAHRSRRREQIERPGGGMRTRMPYGARAEVSTERDRTGAV